MNCKKQLPPRFDPPCWPDVRNRHSPKQAVQSTGRTILSAHVGLRTVALFEAAKGGIVLAAGLGVLELLGHDAQKSAESLVRHFHLNPASHYPRTFLLLAQQVTLTQLWALAAGALAYAVVRFAEAYGLWRGRAWAEWFAVLSSGIYLPLEVWQVIHRATWASGMVLTVNLAIVGFLGWMLAKSHDKRTVP